MTMAGLAVLFCCVSAMSLTSIVTTMRLELKHVDAKRNLTVAERLRRAGDRARCWHAGVPWRIWRTWQSIPSEAHPSGCSPWWTGPATSFGRGPSRRWPEAASR
jgi:hypothetical protein